MVRWVGVCICCMDAGLVSAQEKCTLSEHDCTGGSRTAFTINNMVAVVFF
jgi:hypothetical protein